MRKKDLRSLLFRFALLPALSAAPLLRAQNLINLTAPVMSIPNQGVQITPLAVPGSQFVLLNPGLSDFPNYFAGQADPAIQLPVILASCRARRGTASAGRTLITFYY